jgi:tetratricopeptide (TPR) repeat protein
MGSIAANCPSTAGRWGIVEPVLEGVNTRAVRHQQAVLTGLASGPYIPVIPGPAIFGALKPKQRMSLVNLSPRSILGSLMLAVLLGGVSYVAGCAAPAPAGPPGRAKAIDSYVQGVLAYNNGDADKAIINLKEAVNHHSDLVMAHSMLGDLYQTKRDYKDALSQYQATIKLDPYSYKNYYNEGLMLQLLNRVKEAVVAYLRALELNPKDALSNQNLGVAYLKIDDLDNAIKYCRRAVELNDQSAPAWSNLAVALESARQYKEAENAYRRALELDSGHIEIAVALANNLIQQQRYSEAQSVMDQVVRIDDTAPHRKRLGDTLFLEKRYDEALGEYARAIKIDPHYYPALNETGWSLITEYNQSLGLEEAKRTAALDAWQRSLMIKPNQPRIAQLMQTYSQKFSDDVK